MWDAPGRTLSVSQHPEHEIQNATAGINSFVILMQAVGNKVRRTAIRARPLNHTPTLPPPLLCHIFLARRRLGGHAVYA